MINAQPGTRQGCGAGTSLRAMPVAVLSGRLECRLRGLEATDMRVRRAPAVCVASVDGLEVRVNYEKSTTSKGGRDTTIPPECVCRTYVPPKIIATLPRC